MAARDTGWAARARARATAHGRSIARVLAHEVPLASSAAHRRPARRPSSRRRDTKPRSRSSHPPERLELVRWTARLGAVTAEALADAASDHASPALARGCCGAERARPAAAPPAARARRRCSSATRAGMRLAGLGWNRAARVSAANAAPRARLRRGRRRARAVAIPHHVVSGERELRRDERALRRAARERTAVGDRGADGCTAPTSCCGPRRRMRGLPLAVEVELTRQGARAAAQICLRMGALPLRRRRAVPGRTRGPSRARARDRRGRRATGASRCCSRSRRLLGRLGAARPDGAESPVAGDA